MAVTHDQSKVRRQTGKEVERQRRLGRTFGSENGQESGGALKPLLEPLTNTRLKLDQVQA
jgi:hypothetical protein